MRQAVNIMMLGGAKRVSMGRMLQRAGVELGMDVNLYSYELTAEVPVKEIATVVKGLRWSDPALMANLHDAVEENDIDILLPFVDPAVEIAIRYVQSDPGVWTPGKNPVMAAMMFDKVKADAYFRKCGIAVPPNPAIEDFDGDIIAKPRCGSASKGLKILSHEEYKAMAAADGGDGYLYQRYVARRREYTVDCYVAATGETICTVPRERIAVAGGEVTDTRTLHDDSIESMSRKVLESLNMTGPVTLQFLREEMECGRLGEPLLMEVNPRLGGGAVCAVHAGADIPKFILQDFKGEPIRECNGWEAGTRIARYMQEVVFHSKY